MRLITLTEPNGDEIEVDADQVSELVPNNQGTFARAAKTIVTMQNGHQHAVKETMEHISSLVKVK